MVLKKALSWFESGKEISAPITEEVEKNEASIKNEKGLTKGQPYISKDGVDVNAILESRRLTKKISSKILNEIAERVSDDTFFKFTITFGAKEIIEETGLSESEILSTPISNYQTVQDALAALKKAQATLAIRRYTYLDDIVKDSIHALLSLFGCGTKSEKISRKTLVSLILGQEDFGRMATENLVNFTPDPIQPRNYAGVDSSVWCEYGKYLSRTKSPIMGFNIISWVRSANKSALESHLKDNNLTPEHIISIVEQSSTEQQSPK